MEVRYEEKIVSVCLTAMLSRKIVDDIHAGSESRRGKVIDGSELTHEEESIGYDMKDYQGETC